jgi:hypothetical protein
MVDDRRISNRNDVVAEIVTTEPYKVITKEQVQEQEKETNFRQKQLCLFKHQTLAINEMLS